MQTCNFPKKILEKQIEELNKTVEEIQYNQTEEIMILHKNHTINMKKLDKLQEYNKIADMTNQIFEMRLSGIEQAIKELNKIICAKN